MFHDFGLMQRAQDIINQFLANKSFTVWIEDSEGNSFVPKGKVKINYFQLFTKEKER